jgi:hypothetical protein
MKVNQTNKKDLVAINELGAGTPFKAPRTNNKGEGFYMKVDRFSGLARGIDITQRIAVNLETGQLRLFSYDFKVEPIDAEITVK